jgi:hypothetical protein
MLAAELHDKISPGRPAHERMEDVLTSHVFSLFRYLTDPSLPFRFLGRAVNLAGEALSVGDARDCRLFFWQKFSAGRFGRRREIDAVLIWTAAQGRRIALGVENKDRSSASDTAPDAVGELADEGTDNRPAFTGNQLADEILGMKRGRWVNPECSDMIQADSRQLLLYVTRHHELPVKELQTAIGEVAAQQPGMREELERDVYWLNWRALHDLLTQEGPALAASHSAGETALLRDVREMLGLRKLNKFHPYADLEEVDELILPQLT